MSKVKIYIACHKACEVPSNNVYTPIQVGRAKSNVVLDMIGDDTGDNISFKNETYCETTGHYWVWKNVSKEDAEYVGFCHYRRFFNYNFTEENIDSLFSDGTDVILPSPHYRINTMQHALLLYISVEDALIVRSVIHNLYPEYEPYMDKVLLGMLDYPYNMLVCKKELYDKYSEWIFGVLNECEKYIKLSPYSRARRIHGYITEFLLPVFFLKNGCKIKTIETVFKGENGDIVHKTGWKTKLLCKVVGFMTSMIKKPYMYDKAHVFALKNDGISVNVD